MKILRKFQPIPGKGYKFSSFICKIAQSSYSCLAVVTGKKYFKKSTTRHKIKRVFFGIFRRYLSVPCFCVVYVNSIPTEGDMQSMQNLICKFNSRNLY